MQCKDVEEILYEALKTCRDCAGNDFGVFKQICSDCLMQRPEILAQFLFQPWRVSNKHTCLGLACT